MGILNRTPDSFYDGGEYDQLSKFIDKAAELYEAGADFLDIGGVRLKPGDEVGVDEELDRVIPAVEAVHSRFDIAISVDTFRSAVAKAAFEAGACIGNDTSGFADPNYLHIAARYNASVVASHVRSAPRLDDPKPIYNNVCEDVVRFLAERACWAQNVGIKPEAIMVDAALDLGKTAAMSSELLINTNRLAELGYPTFLSASNKGFLGAITGREVKNRAAATHAAHVMGIVRGARVLRAHDVAAARRVADTASEILKRTPEPKNPTVVQHPVCIAPKAEVQPTAISTAKPTAK